MTPQRGVIPCKTEQEKKTMSNSSVLEGCSESSIVPPSEEQRRPETEQPQREECDVVQHGDALRREGHRETIQE